MSQNPYAQTADFAPPPESRTSVLAILSLVCSLICIVPGLGLLGAILGISALFSISRSQGAVRGNGMAVTGVVVGLLVSVLWIGLGIGAAQLSQMFGKNFVGPVGSMVTAIEAGDYKTARQSFDPRLNAAVTDEQIKAFADAYQAELGHYRAMPKTLVEMIGAYGNIGPRLQNYQGGAPGGAMPLPATFEKGDTLILIMMPQGPGARPHPGPSVWIPQLTNVGVLTPAGKEIWLVPVQGLPPPPPDAPGSDGADQTPPPPADGG